MTKLLRFSILITLVSVAAVACADNSALSSATDAVSNQSADAANSNSTASPSDVETAPTEEVILPFDAPEVAGLCADSTSTFTAGEPSPYTSTEEAVDARLRSEPRFRGLQFNDGKILLRGDEVGRYTVVSRANNTFDIGHVYWCYPDGE